jgi:hypothetical protein
MTEADWREQERSASRRRLRPDTIAGLLQIHEQELAECFETRRKRCGLVSMERPKKLRAKEREDMRANRKKAQRTPRAVYEAMSISQTKPWIEAGFKTRRTWERHGKPVANPCVASLTPNSSLDEEKGDALATAAPSISGAVPGEEREGCAQAWPRVGRLHVYPEAGGYPVETRAARGASLASIASWLAYGSSAASTTSGFRPVRSGEGSHPGR